MSKMLALHTADLRSIFIISFGPPPPPQHYQGWFPKARASNKLWTQLGRLPFPTERIPLGQGRELKGPEPRPCIHKPQVQTTTYLPLTPHRDAPHSCSELHWAQTEEYQGWNSYPLNTARETLLPKLLLQNGLMFLFLQFLQGTKSKCPVSKDISVWFANKNCVRRRIPFGFPVSDAALHRLMALPSLAHMCFQPHSSAHVGSSNSAGSDSLLFPSWATLLPALCFSLAHAVTFSKHALSPTLFYLWTLVFTLYSNSLSSSPPSLPRPSESIFHPLSSSDVVYMPFIGQKKKTLWNPAECTFPMARISTTEL